MSEAIADTLSSRGYGEIYQMAFGNGGASVDETGIITYLPPNTTGQNAALYNQTYEKIVDDTSVFNLDPTRNKMTVSHITGRVYTDILVQCLLDYGEPAGQSDDLEHRCAAGRAAASCVRRAGSEDPAELCVHNKCHVRQRVCLRCAS